MKYRTAIVGPKTVIAGFAALGVEPFVAENVEEVVEILEDLVRKTNAEESGKQTEKYAVVMVMESLLTEVPEKDYRRLTREALPAIISVGSADKDGDWAEKRLRELTVRAVGTDII